MKSLSYFYLIFLLVFASCLPQEKKAQCGEGEAFNTSKRKCEVTLGASSASINIASVTPSSSYTISSVDSPVTHSVAVNDPNNSGFSLRWTILDRVGQTTLLGVGSTLTFNHTSFTPGVYVIEIQLLNSTGSSILDSRSWSVNIIDKQTPQISQVTATPFSTTITSAPTTINANVSNPDLIASINFEWSVNGTPVAGQSGSFSTSTQALSFSFNPTSSSTYFTGANLYSVQLVLKENATGAIYTSATWSISNAIPGLAIATLGVSSLFPTITTPEAGSFVTVIDKLDIPNGGFLLDTDLNGTVDQIDFCVQVDDISGINGNGVFIDFQSNGVVVATSAYTTVNTPICLGVLNPTFFQSIPTTIVAESQTLSAVVYDKFTGNSGTNKYKGFTELSKFDWITRVRQKNTPPRITIVDENPSNFANNAASNQMNCATKTTTTFSGCSITHGAAVPFEISIDVEDDDYDATTDFDKFKVEFFLGGILIDGTHTLSSSDCSQNFNETLSTTRYTCSLQINPFDLNGPINPAGLSYTITAKVTDADSPFLASTKESNILTWNISTVNDNNTGITVNNFANAPVAGNTVSFIRKGGANIALSPTDTGLKELDNITFNLSIDDPERDSFSVIIERCNPTCDGSTIMVQTHIHNSSSNTNPKIIPISHTISQNAVVGAENASVTYRVTVTDIQDAGTTAQTDSTDVTLIIHNKNEDPVFDKTQFNPSLPLASPLIAFTGFPFTIDPGPITDATLSDGKNISYQWHININGAGFIPIVGATSRVLLWSPGQEVDFSNQEGTAVKIKLCIGDDGITDGTSTAKTANCSLTQLDSANDTTIGAALGAWDVTVFSNMANGRSDAAGAGNKSFSSTDHPKGELAIWVDPRSVDPIIKYMAYVNRSREIVIEKLVTFSTGEKAGSVQTATTTDIEFISFDHSTDANFANNIVTDLSITGDTVNDALYIAYMAPLAGIDHVHIRRIDIGTGKSALRHPGKLGFDKSYNGLLTAPSPIINATGGSITLTQNASTNGLVEIQFTGLPTIGIGLTFTGLTSTSVDMIAGTDFCGTSNAISGCATTAATAASFTAALNASNSIELQGLTATNISGSSVVTLAGMASGEFIQQNLGAKNLGQIYINQNLNKWVVPYINGSLGAPHKNKISLFNGDLNTRLVDSNPSSTHLTTTVASVELANDVDSNGRIILATKRESSGEISLYELDNLHFVIDGVADLFSSTNITDIKIAVSKETSEFDQSAFVVGKNQNGRLAYARIDSDSPGEDFDFTTSIVRADLDPAFSLIDGITNFDITAGALENQLLLAAAVDSNSSGTAEEVVLFQITGDTNPIIDCSFDADQDPDKCMRFTSLSSRKAFDLKLALGDVLEDVTIGTAGATANENTQDIIPFAFHVDDGGGSITNDATPIMGIINISATALTSDILNNTGANTIIPYVR